MRPDVTCTTNGIQGVPCTFYFFEGQKHRCRITDEFQALRRSNDTPRGLLTRYDRELLYRFYIFCIQVKLVTPSFGNVASLCVKCGMCCKNDYAISEFREEYAFCPKTGLPELPVAGRSFGICNKLTYSVSSDNNVTDLGFRCIICDMPEFPTLCRNYPDGKDEEFFKTWLDSRKVQGRIRWKSTRFPNCPIEIEEV